MLGFDYPLMGLFWTLLWFFLIFLYIWVLLVIVTDIFRSPDLGGVGKAGWLIFVLVLPVLGVLVYLLARGGSMHERRVATLRHRQTESRSHAQEVASATGSADELGHLYELRSKGVITEEEFLTRKAELLS